MNFVASGILQGISGIVAAKTTAQATLNVRMRVDDGRLARSWKDALRFTVALVNTSNRSIELPGDLTIGKDLQLCYTRVGGRFQHVLRMRSPRRQLISLDGGKAHLDSWSRLSRSYVETPLVQVPSAGLFWVWAELQPSAVKRRPKTRGFIPEGAFQSNPVLIWFQTRPQKLAAELKQIGAAIKRHTSRMVPAPARNQTSAPARMITTAGVRIPIEPAASGAVR